MTTKKTFLYYIPLWVFNNHSSRVIYNPHQKQGFLVEKQYQTLHSKPAVTTNEYGQHQKHFFFIKKRKLDNKSTEILLIAVSCKS